MSKNDDWGPCPHCPMIWQPIDTHNQYNIKRCLVYGLDMDFLYPVIFIASTCSGQWEIEKLESRNVKITHWMPLPKPPK